jgi:lipid-A-disaccharide synthase
MMKKKAYLPYVGLPNILAGEWLVPELLQDDATPENLAQALGNWITHGDAAARVRERFAAMHESLAIGNADRVVAALVPFIQGAPGASNASAQRNKSHEAAAA